MFAVHRLCTAIAVAIAVLATPVVAQEEPAAQSVPAQCSDHPAQSNVDSAYLDPRDIDAIQTGSIGPVGLPDRPHGH